MSSGSSGSPSAATASSKALVGVVMGSRSDWDTMRHAAEMLESSGRSWSRSREIVIFLLLVSTL